MWDPFVSLNSQDPTERLNAALELFRVSSGEIIAANELGQLSGSLACEKMEALKIARHLIDVLTTDEKLAWRLRAIERKCEMRSAVW